MQFLKANISINEALLEGWGTVIPYPCKSGGIYPLSQKVLTLLSLKVLPFEFFIPYPQKYFVSYPLSLKPLTGPSYPSSLK